MQLKRIIRSQCAWADRHGKDRDGHVCRSIDENLFAPLSEVTRAEFASAGGDELGLSGRTAKMRSLRSSSALAVNTFDPWRHRDLGPISEALGIQGRVTSFHFEQRLHHGLASSPPTLDLVLFLKSGPPVGVEVKFCEPYDAAKDHPPIQAKYFAGHRTRWADVGLPRCQTLAARVGREEPYRRLGAGQLLKHLLALANVFGSDAGVQLLYLWFDTDCKEADEHREEIVRFQDALDPRVDFRPLSYHDVISAVPEAAEPVPGHLNYLRQRYVVE